MSFMQLNMARKIPGFTLLEVMVVLGVVALLVAMGSMLANTLQERAAVGRARAELAHISAALEQFKRHFGDYPWVDSRRSGEQSLYAALIGRRNVEGQLLELEGDRAGRPLVDLAVLTVGLPDAPLSPGEAGLRSMEAGDSGNTFLDPWGTPYVYLYRTGAEDEWERAGYLLLSLGPSGGRNRSEGRIEGHGIPASGIVPNDYLEGEVSYDNIISQ